MAPGTRGRPLEETEEQRQHRVDFVNWIDQYDQPCAVSNCLACSLQWLNDCYWAPNENRVLIENALTAFRHDVSVVNVAWIPNGQEDVNELYIKVVERLRDDCPRDEEIINSLLLLTQFETRICPIRGCRNTTTKVVIEPGLEVSLGEIWRRGPFFLNYLIKQAFKTKFDTYNCEAPDWNQRTGRRVTSVIETAPHMLVIHMKRFKWDEETNSGGKRTDLVTFAKHIDMTQHMEGKWPLRYRLRSVVQHRGELNGGHYVTVVRGPSDRWMKMSDNLPVLYTDISGARSLDRQADPKRKKTSKRGDEVWTSYLLFWEKEEYPPLLEPKEKITKKEYFAGKANELKAAERVIGAGRKRKRDES